MSRLFRADTGGWLLPRAVLFQPFRLADDRVCKHALVKELSEVKGKLAQALDTVAALGKENTLLR